MTDESALYKCSLLCEPRGEGEKENMSHHNSNNNNGGSNPTGNNNSNGGTYGHSNSGSIVEGRLIEKWAQDNK